MSHIENPWRRSASPLTPNHPDAPGVWIAYPTALDEIIVGIYPVEGSPVLGPHAAVLMMMHPRGYLVSGTMEQTAEIKQLLMSRHGRGRNGYILGMFAHSIYARDEWLDADQHLNDRKRRIQAVSEAVADHDLDTLDKMVRGMMRLPQYRIAASLSIFPLRVREKLQAMMAVDQKPDHHVTGANGSV